MLCQPAVPGWRKGVGTHGSRLLRSLDLIYEARTSSGGSMDTPPTRASTRDACSSTPAMASTSGGRLCAGLLWQASPATMREIRNSSVNCCGSLFMLLASAPVGSHPGCPCRPRERAAMKESEWMFGGERRQRSGLVAVAILLVIVGIGILLLSGPTAVATLSVFIGAVGLLVIRLATVWFGPD